MLLHPLNLKLYFRGLKTSLSHFLDACYEDKQTYVALSSYWDAQMKAVISEILAMACKIKPIGEGGEIPCSFTLTEKRKGYQWGLLLHTAEKISIPM